MFCMFGLHMTCVVGTQCVLWSACSRQMKSFVASVKETCRKTTFLAEARLAQAQSLSCGRVIKMAVLCVEGNVLAEQTFGSIAVNSLVRSALERSKDGVKPGCPVTNLCNKVARCMPLKTPVRYEWFLHFI